MSYYKNDRDANEAALVQVWRAAGCIWIPQDRHAGFDGILLAHNGNHIVEVKNPARKWKLTKAEQERKAELEARGYIYNIIETECDALALLARKG